MLQFEQVELNRGAFSLCADLTLSPPDRVALIGASGAGKSTLLDLLAGFETPDRGRILWQGQDITRADPADRPVAMLFQDNNLFPHLSLHDNLALALNPRGGRPGADQEARIARSIERVGLAGMADRKPGALSGGQQSRAALARVLLQDKPILALDEPFSALGPALKAEMLELVKSLARDAGALVLLVTHDPHDAQGFAEKTVLIADGIAAPPEETQAFFATPSEELRRYLGA